MAFYPVYGFNKLPVLAPSYGVVPYDKEPVSMTFPCPALWSQDPSYPIQMTQVDPTGSTLSSSFSGKSGWVKVEFDPLIGSYYPRVVGRLFMYADNSSGGSISLSMSSNLESVPFFEAATASVLVNPSPEDGSANSVNLTWGTSDDNPPQHLTDSISVPYYRYSITFTMRLFDANSSGITWQKLDFVIP